MAQPTTLFSDGKSQAQIIALDPRKKERVSSNKKHIRIVQLSGLLSRSLDLEQIILTFSREIGKSFPHTGYRYECADIAMELKHGEVADFNVNYRLKIQNQHIGEITLYRKSGFGSEEICELEEYLCSLIYPIRNAVMYQVALKSAYRDPLTGLSNRASMEKNLPREIDLARRHEQSMAVLVMDLDGFKHINDNYGHDVGDQVLRDVGLVILHAVRNTDLLYRYGGDEFVGALAQTDLDGAIEVCERIRAGVERLALFNFDKKGQIKVSVGLTMVESGDCFSHVFKRADNALYKAKSAGKNQIMIL